MKLPFLAQVHCVIGLIGAILFSSSQLFAQAVPTVTTTTATSVRPGQATVNGSINPNQQATSYWFEHGLTQSYGSFTPTNILAPGTNLVAVSNLLTGLPRGVSYNYRLVASNSVGQVAGGNMKIIVPEGGIVDSSATGSSQPLDIRQPSLELNYIISTSGTFPSPDGSVSPPYFGEVRLFAGNFAPVGWEFCHGQLLSIATHDTLFHVIGTTYGGDGQSTFALPDLRGRTVVGRGTGPDGITRITGESGGSAEITLSQFHLPTHSHFLPPPDSATGTAGSSQPYANMQPYLVMSALFRLSGHFPSPSQLTAEPMIAQFNFFAGNYSLRDLPFASGQLLPINQNQALFAIIGTTYGGNGQTTFALPNLNGRAAMHTGLGPGPNNWFQGNQTGFSHNTLTLAELPVHQHTATSLGINTGATGGDLPRTHMQPSLALRYLISTNGFFPSRPRPAGDVQTAADHGAGEMLGQIIIFAGNYTPQGWLPCEGQLLPIASHTALFALLGTQFGGNGSSTFALPDLSSRVPVGSSNGNCGAAYGAQESVLATAQMPTHTHTVPALDFDRWITSFGLSGSAAAFENDADNDGVKNGFEWATGSNPTNATLFAPLAISSAGSNVLVHFPRNTNATDVLFSLERTAELSHSSLWTGFATNSAGAWTPSAIVNESGATNPVNVSVSDSRTNPATNYRLRVDWP